MGITPLEKTYSDLIQQQLDLYPHKDIFSEYSVGHFQYNRLDLHSVALAAGLSEILGKSKNTSYTVSAPICVESLVGQIAAPIAGKMFGAIDYHLRGSQVLKSLQSTKAGVFLFSHKADNITRVEDIYEVFDYLRQKDYSDGSYINDYRVPDLRVIVQNSLEEHNGLVLHSALLNYTPQPILLKHPLKFNDISSLFVSEDFNTTSLSQYNIINTGNVVGELLGITPDDIVLSTLPLYRAVGQSLGLGLALARRSKLVYPSGHMDSMVVLDALAAHKCTSMFSTQNDWKTFIENTSSAKKKFKDLKQAVVVLNSNEVEDSQLLNKIAEFTGVSNVHVVRGTDETSGAFAVDNVLIPLVEARTVDSNGTVLGPNKSGTIEFKGINVFKGYMNNEKLTNQVLDQGWLRTSLIGRTSPDGTLKLES